MAPNYNTTGHWIVRYCDLSPKNQQQQNFQPTILEQTFDGVMICVGHHNIRNEPKFEGQEQFKGRIMHTHSLKKATTIGDESFDNKNIVVVGIGNSAVDAAVELSTVAKQAS